MIRSSSRTAGRAPLTNSAQIGNESYNLACRLTQVRVSCGRGVEYERLARLTSVQIQYLEALTHQLTRH